MNLSKTKETIEKLELMGLTDELLAEVSFNGDKLEVMWDCTGPHSNLPQLIRIDKEGNTTRIPHAST